MTKLKQAFDLAGVNPLCVKCFWGVPIVTFEPQLRPIRLSLRKVKSYPPRALADYILRKYQYAQSETEKWRGTIFEVSEKNNIEDCQVYMAKEEN